MKEREGGEQEVSMKETEGEQEVSIKKVCVCVGWWWGGVREKQESM